MEFFIRFKIYSNSATITGVSKIIDRPRNKRFSRTFFGKIFHSESVVNCSQRELILSPVGQLKRDFCLIDL